MQKDSGEIISRYRYARKVYPFDKRGSEECLFSSKDLFSKLLGIYNLLGILPLERERLDVKIKLPKNSNPIIRGQWYETMMRPMKERPLIVRLDKLAGYVEGEAVLATQSWMREFEATPGETAVIAPLIPVPESRYF